MYCVKIDFRAVAKVSLAGALSFLYYVSMNKRILRADVLLLLTAAIWGFGFIAQRQGMKYLGPFAFNGIRFLLACLSLLPLIILQSRGSPDNPGEAAEKRNKTFFLSAFLAGSCLFVAVALQQFGMMFTSAGNAGFITGLYVILTPIFGIFLGRKTGCPTWIGALLTFTGLFFLSSGGKFDRVNPGDLIIALSAVFWALHVLVIDRLVQKTSPLLLSFGQFVVAGLYSFAAAFLAEAPLSAWLGSLGEEFHATGLTEWKSFPSLLNEIASGTLPLPVIKGALVNLLYGGLVSAGIGYTLQVVAQKDAPPAHATILLCLEGSFALLGGVLILEEPLGIWTVSGCALMLAGMLISQWELIAAPSKRKGA